VDEHGHEAAVDVATRRERLATHLAQLRNKGATVEERWPLRALVSVPDRQSPLPSIALCVGGVTGWVIADEPLLLIAAGVAVLGWHRRIMAGAQRALVMVRVDESGLVTEQQVDRT
jgi:hypothetical protein